MKILSFASLLGGALLLTSPGPLAAADADEPKLQGKWAVESFDYNGNAVELMKDATRDFKDGKYSLTPKAGDVIEGTYKIDSDQKPKTIDLEVNGRTLKGIYEIEGDLLRMCYVLNDSPRPTEFVSKPDTGVILVVHKRVK